jgi:hypothetical protein
MCNWVGNLREELAVATQREEGHQSEVKNLKRSNEELKSQNMCMIQQHEDYLHEKSISAKEAAQAHQRAMKEMQAEIDLLRKAAEDHLTSTFESQRSGYSIEIQQVKAVHAREMQQAKADHAREMQQMQIDVSRLRSIEKDLLEKLDKRLEKKPDKKLDKKIDRQQAEISTLREQTKKLKNGALVAQISIDDRTAEIELLKKEIEGRDRSVERVYGANPKRFTNEVGYEAEAAALKTKLEDTEKALQKKEQKLQTALQKKEQELQTALNLLNGDQSGMLEELGRLQGQLRYCNSEAGQYWNNPSKQQSVIEAMIPFVVMDDDKQKNFEKISFGLLNLAFKHALTKRGFFYSANHDDERAEFDALRKQLTKLGGKEIDDELTEIDALRQKVEKLKKNHQEMVEDVVEFYTALTQHNDGCMQRCMKTQIGEFSKERFSFLYASAKDPTWGLDRRMLDEAKVHASAPVNKNILEFLKELEGPGEVAVRVEEARLAAETSPPNDMHEMPGMPPTNEESYDNDVSFSSSLGSCLGGVLRSDESDADSDVSRIEMHQSDESGEDEISSY